VIVLRKKQPEHKRGFRVPSGSGSSSVGLLIYFLYGKKRTAEAT
jgi:hypothetical protein